MTVSWRSSLLYAAEESSEQWLERLSRAAILLGRNLSLDMHMHPALFPVKDIPHSSNPRPYRGDDAFSSRVQGMRQGQMWTGFFSPVVDAPVLGMTPHGPGMVRSFGRGEAWLEFKRQIALLDDLVGRNDVVKARTIADVEAAHAAGRVAAIYGCEGGDHIEDKPERVEEIYALASIYRGFFSPVVDAPVLGMTPHGPGMVRSFGRGEAWLEFKRQIALLDDLVGRNDVVKARTIADVEAAHAAGRVAAIYGCEGGDHIEDKPERVEEIYAAGVRSLQIYHVALNSLVESDGTRDIGLSAVGRETLQEMNRVGMLADLAHASFETTAAAAEISMQPILSTHSLIRASDDSVRGIGMSTDHARVIAETGGVIGAFGGFSGGLAGFVENVVLLIDTVGIDHVGIGTDMDGTGNVPAAFDRYTLLPEIAARLLARGLEEEELVKIIGGNVARVLEQVRPHAQPNGDLD